MVARAALNALEGLLWKSIRGAGLAYGANIISDVERGFTYFRVSRPFCCHCELALTHCSSPERFIARLIALKVCLLGL